MWQLVRVTDNDTGKTYLMVCRDGEVYRSVQQTKLINAPTSIEVVVRDGNRGFLEEVARLREEEVLVIPD